MCSETGYFHHFIDKERKKKLMARSINSDYIDFSHMGGFDMGIDFNGFEENVKNFMEVVVVPCHKFDV
jgi:hypothetical protein